MQTLINDLAIETPLALEDSAQASHSASPTNCWKSILKWLVAAGEGNPTPTPARGRFVRLGPDGRGNLVAGRRPLLARPRSGEPGWRIGARPGRADLRAWHSVPPSVRTWVLVLPIRRAADLMVEPETGPAC